MFTRAARRAAILWLLVFTTTLWGETVTSHLHLQPEHGVCIICALPHLGGAAPPEIALIPPAAAVNNTPEPLYHYSSVSRSYYQSRAPPA